MGQLNFSHISEEASERMLKFLNQAFRPSDILNKLLIKSDQTDKRDYGIGPVVAGRIIKHRKTFPRWRFTDISQLNGIKGFGQDKLDDLVDTFSISSAQHFVHVIKTRPVLFENFPLTFHPIKFENEKDFEEIRQDEEKLRQLVVNNIEHLASRQGVDAAAISKAQSQLSSAYIEKFNTAFLGAYAWAVWFYGFDADNWFGFDQMRIPIEEYLYENGDDPSLYLFKGFENRLILRGITVLDLPVVVHPLEKCVYLWAAELFD